MGLQIKRKTLKIVFIILSIILLISFLLIGLTLANKNKLVYGLKIADIDIGGLIIDKAFKEIENQTNEFFKEEVVLKCGDEGKIWLALPRELGIKINIDSTLKKASEIGHQGKFFLRISQQVSALLGYYNLYPSYQIDENQLGNLIKEKLGSIDNPAVNASWQYDKKIDDFVPIFSQEGRIIDRKNLKKQLYYKIENLSENDISLYLINDHPKVLENETKKAHIKAWQILANAPYKLFINDPTRNESFETFLTKEDLISLIEFRPVLDKENPENEILGTSLGQQALKNYLIALSPSINRTPVNAQLTFKGGKVTNFVLSRDGIKLEIEKNIPKIRNGILNRDRDNDELKEKGIELEVSTTPPKIATKDINNMGITSLIGRGVSNFAGSPINRIHNIKLGAARFQGVLIKPREEFSFNIILGESGPEQGYLPELVIKRDKTIAEYGGGLCQVSTTTFRAAIYAGLPIIERYPHAFPVQYYNPQGFDATIYPPHPDLRFVNDTPNYLLVQTKTEGYYLIFEFYGTDDGRKVKLDGPYQYDIKPDGSMKAEFTRTIYKNDKLIEEKTFYSNYKSPNLYPTERNPLE